MNNNLKKKLAIVLTSTTLSAGLLLVAPSVLAHTDPIGCDSTGVSLSLTVLRADGVTSVGGGTVQVGETIKYRATLSHGGGSNCNYEGGDLDINTPDGANHDVDGGAIPLVSSGSPFVGTLVTYVVGASDIGGDNDIDASAVYSGGTSHLGGNVSPIGANTPAATQVSGNIIVDKVSNPSSEQDFEFDPSWTTNFFLDDTDAPVDSGNLAPGAYSVAEVNLPANWVLTNTNCVSSLGDVESAASLELDANETIT